MTTAKQSPFVSVQRGMALVAALFLIVVLAALGLYAVRIGSAQQTAATAALLDARALAAAESGIEYAANRGPQNNDAVACNGAKITYALVEGGLQGFAVDVTCTLENTSSGKRGYRFMATGYYGTFGTQTFVSHTLTRAMTN